MTIFEKLFFGSPVSAAQFAPLPQAQKSKLGQTKNLPAGDNPKDSRNTEVRVRKCHKDKICCPKVFVTDKQTDRQTDILRL